METLVGYRERDTLASIPARTHPEPMTLPAAIRACRSGRLTQDELAAKASIGQSTLSQWENGKSTPDLNQVRAIEDACGRPRGWIAVQAGYVEVSTLKTAIEVAPELDDQARSIMLDALDALEEFSSPP